MIFICDDASETWTLFAHQGVELNSALSTSRFKIIPLNSWPSLFSDNSSEYPSAESVPQSDSIDIRLISKRSACGE